MDNLKVGVPGYHLIFIERAQYDGDRDEIAVISTSAVEGVHANMAKRDLWPCDVLVIRGERVGLDPALIEQRRADHAAAMERRNEAQERAQYERLKAKFEKE